jgi:hypothetical protein
VVATSASMLAITSWERITSRVFSFMRTTERYDTMPMAPRNRMATAKPMRTLRSVVTRRLAWISPRAAARRRMTSPISTLASTPTSWNSSQCANTGGDENAKLPMGETTK